MRPKITSGGLTSFPSVRRPFMVRLMQLLGRRGVLGIVLFVAVAVAGILGSRLFTTAGAAARAPCPSDPRVALGCYEQRYRSIVAGQGVAAAFAALKTGYGADRTRSEEHTSELQSHSDLVCRLLLEKKKKRVNAIRC